LSCWKTHISRPNWRALGLDEQWAEEFQTEVESKFGLLATSPDNWLDAARRNDFTEMIRLAVGVYVATGEVLATWKTSKGSKRVDVSAIPTSVASQYMKEFPGSRRFNLKLKSE
jgi:hypothetical protein